MIFNVWPFDRPFCSQSLSFLHCKSSIFYEFFCRFMHSILFSFNTFTGDTPCHQLIIINKDNLTLLYTNSPKIPLSLPFSLSFCLIISLSLVIFNPSPSLSHPLSPSSRFLHSPCMFLPTLPPPAHQ